MNWIQTGQSVLTESKGWALLGSLKSYALHWTKTKSPLFLLWVGYYTNGLSLYKRASLPFFFTQTISFLPSSSLRVSSSQKHLLPSIKQKAGTLLLSYILLYLYIKIKLPYFYLLLLIQRQHGDGWFLFCNRRLFLWSEPAQGNLFDWLSSSFSTSPFRDHIILFFKVLEDLFFYISFD